MFSKVHAILVHQVSHLDFTQGPPTADNDHMKDQVDDEEDEGEVEEPPPTKVMCIYSENECYLLVYNVFRSVILISKRNLHWRQVQNITSHFFLF